MNARPSRHDRVLFGGFVGLPSLLSVEGFVRAGYDFVVLDLQHGTFSYEFALNAIQLLDVVGVESLLRLTSDELPLASRLLDLARAGSCLHRRRAGERRNGHHGHALPTRRHSELWQQRNGLKAEPADLSTVRPSIWAMIETKHGLENVEAIAAVPGLTGLLIGPSDLGLALGLGPGAGVDDPAWSEAIESIRLAAVNRGIGTCMVVGGGMSAAEWARAGFDRVIIGSDVLHLLVRLNAEISQARSLLRGSSPVL